MSEDADKSERTAGDRRVIKRYSNRKLYDTKDSRYVTLLQIAEMVRSGGDVQIIDNNSKEDLTEVTLAQIILEEKKANNRSVPLQTLKDLIHQRTEKVLSDLREGPIGRLIPGTTKSDPPNASDEAAEIVAKDAGAQSPSGSPPKPNLVAQAKVAVEDMEAKIDERVRTIAQTFFPWLELQEEVKRLSTRVQELEEKLAAVPVRGGTEPSSSSSSGSGNEK